MKVGNRKKSILIIVFVLFFSQPALSEKYIPAEVGWNRHLYPDLVRSPSAQDSKPGYFTKNFILIFSEFKKYWKSKSSAKAIQNQFGELGSRVATKMLYLSILRFFPEEKDSNRTPSSFFLESDSNIPYIHRSSYPIDFIMTCDFEKGNQRFKPIREFTDLFVSRFKSYKIALESESRKQIKVAERNLKKQIGTKTISKVKKLYTSD